MGFVLDASTAVSWALGETGRRATRAWTRINDDYALVPSLWWFEVRNALIVNERRGRIGEQQTTRFLRAITRLPITIDRTPDESDILSLARRCRLTVYDAAYLELALRTGLPPATLDAALAAATRAEGVPLIGEDKN